MSDPTNPGGRPPYSQYQLDLYAKAILAGETPITTTDPNKLEDQARKHMPAQGFNYVYGGAGEQSTMHANRLAFRQWKIVPRFLRPTLPRDLTVELFGTRYDSPLLMAPVGVQSAYHPDAEPGLAAACADLRVPFVYSTASSTTLEEVASAADRAFRSSVSSDRPEEDPQPSTTGPIRPDGGLPPAPPSPDTLRAPRWFQLYRPQNPDLTASLLRRAKAAGCTALVVTLDTFTLSWRPADLDTGYLPFIKGQGNALGFSDPVFRASFAAQSDGETPEDNVLLASRAWTSEVFSGRAHTWDSLRELRSVWGPDRPILLKGVLSVADAVKARETGMDGIVVSNHGGRQLDGAVAALEVLPEIVDAVGGDMAVLFDSGVRTGADVIKALALGARAVLVGRPVIYGLGIAGKEGARHVLAGLLADLDQSMGLAGVKSVRELDRGMLRKVVYGGDVRSNL